MPGYRTQQSATQAVTVGTKRVFDAYGLWTFNPQAALRLSAGNLTARDYETGSLSLTQDAVFTGGNAKDAGTNKPILVSNVALDGADAGNRGKQRADPLACDAAARRLCCRLALP